ncbi:predicted protein [Plenodomus lingam JN3]|uniref:Predicted protein n=1 Tax=Leptosphaeria maculans (strain JN3 / isolate v23.1.3 / race Av1-4-5-6-7-8) TaxID=985895 RepID=E4ZJ79_LEPMJ|nr:predicted protein [Plenodomus lingam JN3]CBX91510.1 predicted protein [Plenodomus lingam JN3]
MTPGYPKWQPYRSNPRVLSDLKFVTHTVGKWQPSLSFGKPRRDHGEITASIAGDSPACSHQSASDPQIQMYAQILGNYITSRSQRAPYFAYHHELYT